MSESFQSKIESSQPIAHPIQNVFSLLSVFGDLEEGDIKVNYEEKNSHLSIAVPSLKFGIAFRNDHVDELIADGWHVESLNYDDIEPFSRVMHACSIISSSRAYMKMDPTVKNTSKPEDKILTEILRRMLPQPDRNYKFTRDDGSELTVPDFTWEEYKICFFMDGAYWHSIKDDKEIIKKIKSNAKIQNEIIARRKDKVRKDGLIRSELASRGWLVLMCTDEDIETDEGLHSVVDQIERAINRSQQAQKVTTDNTVNSSMSDLFDIDYDKIEQEQTTLEQNIEDESEELVSQEENLKLEPEESEQENIELKSEEDQE